jgi:hypothetical protein
MKQRRAVPVKVKDQLMVANRHTCCICTEPRHPVEKHHINGDPADNAWNNLAVVCRNCHGLVTQRGNLGAQYTQGEVLLFKLRWEKRCAEAREEEIDSPLEELREIKIIEGGEHEAYPFDLKRGQELVFSIDADDPLDLIICDEEDIESWAESEGDDDEENEGEDDQEDDDEDEDEEGDDEEDTDEDDRSLPDGYWFKTGVIECGEKSFIADEATEVTVDATVWAAE